MEHSPSSLGEGITPPRRYDAAPNTNNGVTPPSRGYGGAYYGGSSPTQGASPTATTGASPFPRRPLGHGLTPPSSTSSQQQHAYAATSSASPQYRAYAGAPSSSPSAGSTAPRTAAHRDPAAPLSSREGSSPTYWQQGSGSPQARSPTSRYDAPPQSYHHAASGVGSGAGTRATMSRFTAAADAQEQHMRLRSAAAAAAAQATQQHPYQQHYAAPVSAEAARLASVMPGQYHGMHPQQQQHHHSPLAAQPRRSSSSSQIRGGAAHLHPQHLQQQPLYQYPPHHPQQQPQYGQQPAAYFAVGAGGGAAVPAAFTTPRRASSSSGRSPGSTQLQQQYGDQPLPSASPGQVKPTLRPNVTLVDECDPATGAIVRRYQCGALLGKGGFARVYLFTDVNTGEEYAAKVVDKTKLTDQSKYQKLLVEIDIHARLDHPNVVKIHRHFEDDCFMYILLEKCTNQTLLELSRNRVSLSLAEVQYLMLQLLKALGYLHSVNVIHRDLKLANILVDDVLQLKIGDFGLAAATQSTDEVKRTMCGTPNYIAPEILTSNTNKKRGYTYRADYWSLGVIMYTLFVGCPPFETPTLTTTYELIQKGSYSIPATVPAPARHLINRILKVNPDLRPSLVEMRSDAFFNGCHANDMPADSLIEYYSRLTGVSFAQLRGRIAEVTSLRQQREALEASAASTRARLRPPPLSNQNDADELHGVTSPSASSHPPPPQDRLLTISPLSGTSSAHHPHHFASSPSAMASPTSAHAPPRSASPTSPTLGGGDDFIPQLGQALVRQQAFAVGSWNGPRATTTTGGGALTTVPPLSRVALPTHDAGNLTMVVDIGLFSRYGLAYRMNTGHQGAFFNDRSKLVYEALTGMAEYHDRPPRLEAGAPPHTAFGSDVERFNVLREGDPFLLGPNKKKGTLGVYFRDYFATRRAEAARYVALNHDPAAAADSASPNNAASRIVTCHLPVADPEYWEAVRQAATGPPVLCCVPGTSAALLRDGRAALQSQQRLLMQSGAGGDSGGDEHEMHHSAQLSGSMLMMPNGVRSHPTSHVAGLPLPDPLPAPTTLMNMHHVRRSAFVGFDQVPAMAAAFAAPRGMLETLRSFFAPALSSGERAMVESVLTTAMNAVPVAAAILKLSNGDSQITFFNSEYCMHQNSNAATTTAPATTGASPTAAAPASAAPQLPQRVEPFPPVVVANATLIFHHRSSGANNNGGGGNTDASEVVASTFSILLETAASVGLGEASFGRYQTSGAFALLDSATTAAMADFHMAGLPGRHPSAAAQSAPTNAAAAAVGELVVNMSDGPTRTHRPSAAAANNSGTTSFAVSPMETAMAWARCLSACVWLQRAVIALEAAPNARGLASPGAVRYLQ